MFLSKHHHPLCMLLIAAAVLLWLSAASSAIPRSHALWAKAIGDQATLEICYAVAAASDNGSILAGRRSPDAHGAKSNVVLIKTDAGGNVQWTSEIDPFPAFNSNSRALGVVQAHDGGYVAAGWAESPDYGDEGYLAKTDASGHLQWHYIYGNVNLGSGADDDSFSAVASTADGGYIVAGTTVALARRGWSDAWLLKVNASGYVQWSEVYGGNGLEYANAVIQTSDGGYAFAGSTNSFGDEMRVFVQKTSANGSQQWLNVIDLNGSSDSGDQEGLAIRQTADHGYLVAGTYEMGADPGVGFLLRLDAAGNELWRRSFNLGSGNEVISGVALAADGGYMAAGRTNSGGSGSYDALVIKTDGAGNVAWAETYGGSNYDAAYAIDQTGDGGHVVGGKAVGLQWAGGTDMYLIRFAKTIPTLTNFGYLPLMLNSAGG